MFKKLKNSYKRKLFLSLIIVALCPLVISGASIVQLTKTALDSREENKTQEQIMEVQNRLSEHINKTEEVIDAIIADKGITEDVSVEEGEKRNTIYRKLYAYAVPLQAITVIDVYDTSGVCMYSTGTSSYVDSLPPYWGILKQAATHTDDIIISKATNFTAEADIVLQLAKAITDEDGDVTGYVVAAINSDNLDTILDGSYDKDNSIAILDNYWDAIYSTDKAIKYDVAVKLRERRMGGGPLSEKEDQLKFDISKMEGTELYIVLCHEPAFTTDITSTMIYVIIAMTIFSLILCTAIATYLSRNLTKPIDRMTKAMSNAEHGNLKEHIDVDREDELGKLSDSFNTMISELDAYTTKQVENEKELNAANVAMMQAQLNPHFLYNTLDTIKWVAKSRHIPELATLSSGLAKILRSSISSDKFVTLADELAMVDSYVDVQKVRFAGNFTYDCEVPIEYEDFIIPKLVVQPIVENAIIHGLDGCEDGHIYLKVYENHNNLHIEVWDDGCGMSDDMINMINNKSYKDYKGHLGLYNVDTIVRIYFGEQYGLRARRIDGEGVYESGTVVTLVLPKKRTHEEVEDV